MSKLARESDVDAEAPSFRNLVSTITDDRKLWNDYRVALWENNIATNSASKEYLSVFIEKNRECIEAQYFTSVSMKTVENVPTVKKEKKEYIGSARCLCNMVLNSFKDEIVYTTNRKRVSASKIQVSQKGSIKGNRLLN